MNAHLKIYFSNSQLKIAYFLLLLLLFNSCFSVKPSSIKSSENYFETFYVGEQGTQYFIKPILFKSKNSNDELFMDFTFRYKNEIKDSVIVNFSVKSSFIYKTIDSLMISNKNTEIKSNEVELLFNEKDKTDFVSRFTTKFSLKDITEIFDNNDWVLTINNQNQTTDYIPHRKAYLTINTLMDKIFILM